MDKSIKNWLLQKITREIGSFGEVDGRKMEEMTKKKVQFLSIALKAKGKWAEMARRDDERDGMMC